jgi:hypothetical protein
VCFNNHQPYEGIKLSAIPYLNSQVILIGAQPNSIEGLGPRFYSSTINSKKTQPYQQNLHIMLTERPCFAFLQITLVQLNLNKINPIT